MHGVDVVDTVWNKRGPAAPALELIIFCQKLCRVDVNMDAVAKINEELLSIRRELDKYAA